MKETKGFLLKTYLENHKPRVDGNTSECASMHQNAYQYSNQGYRERKHKILKKLKIAVSAIFAYTSRLMCLKIKSWNTTKSVLSHKERKTTNYLPTLVKLFVIQFPTTNQ